MVTGFVRSITGVAAVLTLAGCNSGTEPFDQLVALDRAEARWNASGIHNYTFDIGGHSSWFQDSVRVVVRNDTVASRAVLSGGSPSSGNSTTVSQLFASIRSSLAYNSAVTASYDFRLGYPTHVNVPDPPGVADAAWGVNIGNFRAVP